MNDLSFPHSLDSSLVEIERWQNGHRSSSIDTVAAEVPIALEYNGISHVVMLASPTDLEDFALGFSLTEGIIQGPEDLFETEIETLTEGIQVSMRICGERMADLKARRRNLAGRTGCGLCGTDSLKQVFRNIAPVRSSFMLTHTALQAALDDMRGNQYLQALTGATHAAAWVTAEGSISCLREDIGRHNALDKLIGALARDHTDFNTGAAVITSRASYEMVQKAASVGIGMIAAVSAPTALAIRMANELDVTLVGFARPGNHVIYTYPQRLLTESKGSAE